ncbi:MAG: hypothetical protein R3C44_16200 [Chloroflexota bacterium]
MADFTSDLLMRGTTQRSFEEIYEALESVGPGCRLAVGDTVRSLRRMGWWKTWTCCLISLTQSLCYPTFPAEQVEQVRGQIMTGLQMRANDTG